MAVKGGLTFSHALLNICARLVLATTTEDIDDFGEIRIVPMGQFSTGIWCLRSVSVP